MSIPTYLPYIVLTGNALTLAAIFYGLNRALAEASWPRPERLRALTISAAILLGWLAMALGLSSAGFYHVTENGIPTVQYGLLLPIIIGIVLIFRSELARRILDAVPQPWIVGVQLYRALGVVFLILYAAGDLPGLFALPAGIGDIAVGLAAPLVGYAYARAPGKAAGLVRAWNTFGILDLTIAVTMGFLTSPSAIAPIQVHPSSELVTMLPMVMIPVYMVPLSIVLHIASLFEAGLGHMGIHRNLIHPRFGNFVLLGTVLTELEVDNYDHPIEYNPCLECKLCVAACPVGAIGPDGSFNFSSCFTHNYREFLGGFSDWVEQVADARDAFDYRKRIAEGETASMWQSLGFGPNYKSAYFMAVCPAGEDVIGPYLHDKQRHLREVVRPLQERAEPVYVVKGSDAEAAARRKFKNKTVKPVSSGLRARTIGGLLTFMPFVFQPNQSRGLDAVFHFKFTGMEERKATITIRNRTIDIKDGLLGKPNLRVTADAKTWLGFLAQEKSLPLALLRRKIRIQGDPRLLLKFGKCFPSAGPRHEQVELLPEPSLLKREPSRYLKNDPATGKLRWLGALVLAEKEDVTHNVRTFRLRPANGAEIPFDYLPGQFLTLHIAPGGVPTKRSYTIASSPTWRDRIEITVKREEHGLVSRWLHDELKPGDEVEIEAPNGTFYFTGKDAESVVLIGGGVGITPMMSAVRYLTETGWPGTIHLILGFRTPSDFIFQDETVKLEARNPNLRVTVTMSRPDGAAWTGRKGQIDAALLAAAVPGIASHLAHICGPPAMMDAVKAALIGLVATEGQIRTEAFGTIKRDPTAKGVGSTTVAGKVFFQASNATAPVFAGSTILDAADAAGVFIDNACRSGTCGSCRVKLASGAVRMPVEDALTKEDKAGGYILACQAEISGDVAVDA